MKTLLCGCCKTDNGEIGLCEKHTAHYVKIAGRLMREGFTNSLFDKRLPKGLE